MRFGSQNCKNNDTHIHTHIYNYIYILPQFKCVSLSIHPAINSCIHQIHPVRSVFSCPDEAHKLNLSSLQEAVGPLNLTDLSCFSAAARAHVQSHPIHWQKTQRNYVSAQWCLPPQWLCNHYPLGEWGHPNITYRHSLDHSPSLTGFASSF